MNPGVLTDVYCIYIGVNFPVFYKFLQNTVPRPILLPYDDLLILLSAHLCQFKKKISEFILGVYSNLDHFLRDNDI